MGSRDIVLQGLVENLTPDQRDLLLQAALSRAPFGVDDLVHIRHGDSPVPEQAQAVRKTIERLVDLTLVSRTSVELVVHPWIADGLSDQYTDDELVERHSRAAQMRLRRINGGGGWSFDDLVDLVRHLALSQDYDSAVAVALQGCDLVGGELAASALLAETVPLIPTSNGQFLVLGDRECEALLNIGLASATASRRQPCSRSPRASPPPTPAPRIPARPQRQPHNLGNLAVIAATPLPPTAVPRRPRHPRAPRRR